MVTSRLTVTCFPISGDRDSASRLRWGCLRAVRLPPRATDGGAAMDSNPIPRGSRLLQLTRMARLHPAPRTRLTQGLRLGLAATTWTRGSPPRFTPGSSTRPTWTINGEGIITATVVSAASIAAAAGHLMDDTRLILAILGSELIYMLAHVHARALGDAVVHRAHPRARTERALAETWRTPTLSSLGRWTRTRRIRCQTCPGRRAGMSTSVTASAVCSKPDWTPRSWL